MKALVIADNKLAIDNISQVLEMAGYDVIVYKWLLKALDNIEEIGPHLIVVSAKDYPRHWKTLAQFSSTEFSSYIPQVILYAEGGLDSDEEQKANALGIRGIFTSVDVEGLEQLRSIISAKVDIYSGHFTDEDKPVEQIISAESETEDEADEEIIEASDLTESEVTEEIADTAAADEYPEDFEVDGSNVDDTDDFPITTESLISDESFGDIDVVEEDAADDAAEETAEVIADDTVEETVETADEPVVTINCSFMFTNPVSGSLISGYAHDFDGEKLYFDADIKDLVSDLNEGTVIDCATLKTSDDIHAVCAKVVSNEECLVLELDR